MSWLQSLHRLANPAPRTVPREQLRAVVAATPDNSLTSGEPLWSRQGRVSMSTHWIAVRKSMLSAWRAFWRAIGAGLLSNIEILVLATLLENLGAFRWTREYWWGLLVLVGKDVSIAVKAAIAARLAQRKAVPVTVAPPTG